MAGKEKENVFLRFEGMLRMKGDPMLDVKDLRVRFDTDEGTANVVNGVDIKLDRGDTLAILGESGSGKSVTLRALMRLLPKRRTRISGSVKIDGEDILTADDSRLTALRGGTVSMIFQEPRLAFDPVFKIGMQIKETIRQHERISDRSAYQRALEMLEHVQIPSARSRMDNYPHEMSGGMLQRAMIALALSCRPKLLLADEPTTALDATVQIQILLLLRSLQKEFNMSVVFVTHDIGVAVEMADNLAVMYAGRFVETAPVRSILRDSKHPYSRGLMSSTIGSVDSGVRLKPIPGAPPNMTKQIDGCPFAPRCSDRFENCTLVEPRAESVDERHRVLCHLYQ